MTTHSLNGAWELRQAPEFDAGWAEQDLPAFWQQQPGFTAYTGKMVYRKAFPFNPDPGRMYRIRLEGVFGTHRVFLNGHELGGGRGYFIPHEYDVTGRLNSENILVIETDNETGTGPCAGPRGIWRPVALIESGRHFIISARVDTRSMSESNATLVSTIRVWSPADVPVTLTVKMRPAGDNAECARIEKTYFLVAGENDLLDRWNLSPYRPWWTYDQGRPELYEAEVEVSDEDGASCDRLTVRFGIRTVQIKKRAMILNGRKIPVRLVATRATRFPAAEPEKDTLERARESGANLCRVRGHVEPPEFYQAADDAGVLIWQDHPFAETGGGPKQQAEAVEGALEMVSELGGHPSVAFWFAGQKPEQNPEEGFLQRFVFAVGRRYRAFRISRLITGVLRDADMDRPVVSSMKAVNASFASESE